MDNSYLEELIREANIRDGGLILSQNDQPAAVVMTVHKYNELLQKSSSHQNRAMQSIQAEDFHSNNNKTILVTGGAGYIGSHAVRELLKTGYGVVIVDNLSTGKRNNVPEGVKFYEGDIADTNFLRDIFASHKIYAVMHFAASIEVEESVAYPEKYLENNMLNTARLLSVMNEAAVKRIIFSSTAAVYGNQDVMPISEYAKVQPNNPYGYSKLLAERTIKYYCHFSGFQAVVFRYFNACGCDFDGSIIATHTSHLFSRIMEVAGGIRPFIAINGTDYNTVDGTCVRDYVHVLDIANAHVLALEKIDTTENYRIYNIGTGKGSSVLEVIQAVSESINRIIPMEQGPRRPGDAFATVADNSKIREDLGFELKYSDLETIAKTSWIQMQHAKQII